MVRLLYISKTNGGFNSDGIESILASARKNNEKMDVTGMLCFSHKYFMQCLEGDRDNVNKIYHQIANDERHSDIVILQYSEIFTRDFSEWSMGYVPDTSITKELNLKYSNTAEFQPYLMAGESAHQFLLSLRDSLPSI
ncbi:BLUF domain-containing protein [Pleionea sediminis]|uniref:BLUF domain-containing protein n=1 Tax=Pleionea sediminis TaxID=2569479 RepID=UPI001FE3D172|nr:BLUF domain-containing protein [Pleionea sediminis]